MRLTLCVFCFFIYSIAHSQESVFDKSYFAGSTAKIPENKVWVIKSAYISAGDGYTIQIALSNFKEYYVSEEVITFPSYIADMELLSNKSMVSYIVRILEK